MNTGNIRFRKKIRCKCRMFVLRSEINKDDFIMFFHNSIFNFIFWWPKSNVGTSRFCASKKKNQKTGQFRQKRDSWQVILASWTNGLSFAWYYDANANCRVIVFKSGMNCNIFPIITLKITFPNLNSIIFPNIREYNIIQIYSRICANIEYIQDYSRSELKLLIPMIKIKSSLLENECSTAMHFGRTRQ